MEASALPETARSPQALLGRSPLLRLQSDEKLIALTRRGNPAAFDALVHRYQARLLSFLRHMLGSTEDAEDVLQEVFASAFNAICSDERPINARPWLYRIARNRALNHLRRPTAAGQDTMDVFERAAGETTADAVHKREDFRQLVADVQELPETQRTALLMREIDALSYEQIAEAMETTVPSVKSLLVRARVGLAEAAEARTLSCAEVRLALAEDEEGVAKVPASVRRHVKGCDRCRAFRSELKRTTKVLAALLPVGPLVAVQKLLAGKLGASSASGASTGGSGFVGGSTVAGGSAWGGGAAASGSAMGGVFSGGMGTGVLSTGAGALATKAAAGLVAAAVVTAGAVEVVHLTEDSAKRKTPSAAADAARDHGGGLLAAGGALGAGVAGAAASPAGPREAVGAAPDGGAEPATADPQGAGAPEPAAPGDDASSPTSTITEPGADPAVPPDTSVGSDGSVAPPRVDSGSGSPPDGSGGGVSPGDGGVSGSEGGGDDDGSGSSGGGGETPPSGPPGDPTGSAPGAPGAPPVVGEPGL